MRGGCVCRTCLSRVCRVAVAWRSRGGYSSKRFLRSATMPASGDIAGRPLTALRFDAFSSERATVAGFACFPSLRTVSWPGAPAGPPPVVGCLGTTSSVQFPL